MNSKIPLLKKRKQIKALSGQDIILKKDLSGLVFGDLTALCVHFREKTHIRWRCECKCRTHSFP
jgi:hypothetical protein